MGVEKSWGRTVVIQYSEDTWPSAHWRHHPLEIVFQVFGFKGVCGVSAATLSSSSTPDTKDLRIFVSDARLHQLQHWLQLLIKLLAVRARNAKTRLLSNRPFWPRCLRIWCVRKLLLRNQLHSTQDGHSQHLLSVGCDVFGDGVWERDYRKIFSFSFSYLIRITRRKIGYMEQEVPLPCCHAKTILFNKT